MYRRQSLSRRPSAALAAGLLATLLLTAGCARTITTGPGAQGGPSPGSAGGRPGMSADITTSPSTTPSQPLGDNVTTGDTVTPVGSGPGGTGMQYP